MYSAVMNNSLIDWRCVNELTESGTIDSYLEIYDLIRSDIPEGLTERTTVRLKDAAGNRAVINKAYEQYEKIISAKDIKVISSESGHYPEIWQDLPGMPRVFFARGDITAIDRIDTNGSVAVVGSRDAGRYPLYATKSFVTRLAEKKVVIVSGMAMGIDRAAHQAAMDAGGTTVAVMPCGADRIYPTQNNDVYERIVSGGGVVISEMPPGTGVKKQYFPSRNRLISALSDCCLIMEAGEYSGTLHTASYAAYQGRDVFVLPNSIYADNSMGGLKLINDGAGVLLDVNDVIDSIAEKLLYRKVSFGSLTESPEDMKLAGIRNELERFPENVSDDDLMLVIRDELTERNMTSDELASGLRLPIYRITSLLPEMEMRSLIHKERGKYALTLSEL